MSLRLATRLLAGALLVLAVGSGPVAAQSLSAGQKEEVERIIRSYLLDHPEVLVEALQAAEEKSKKEAEEHARKAIGERRDQLVADPAAPVAGNPNGDVTIVEFFDYRCPYCKQVQPSIRELLGSDKQIRFVYKEFPVLGKESVFAGKAALAAARQGKYEPFHNALMANKGQLSDDVVFKTADSVGLDVERL
jgi:protein-disulfide isomerase